MRLRIFLSVIVLSISTFSSLCYCQNADAAQLERHLRALTGTTGFRNYQNPEALAQTVAYIKQEFEKTSGHISIQSFLAGGKVYHNVICSFDTLHEERIVVGAHYDVCGDQPGADDNASGVSGLLEIARMLSSQKLKYRVDLVAYALEEPPYFRSASMGSLIHAQSLYNQQAKVKGMISLEMIGYFSDEKNSQHYPLGILKLFYGTRGDFITVVQKFGAGKFARRYTRKMKRDSNLKVKSFKGTAALPGIDFSDHLNYWRYGYSAVMITDTSFYRNSNYHQPTDTIETLSITKMKEVVDAVFSALQKI